MHRVLLVEDDKYLNKLLSDRLLIHGLKVTSCLDGESALEELEKTKNSPEAFSCLIVDMLLPRMMGAELLSRLNETGDFSDLRKIAISGVYRDETQIKEISHLHNLESYWTKPFDLYEFIAAVSQDNSMSKSSLFRSGTLHEHPIEKVYFEAYQRAFTGKLIIRHQGQERRVYFINGHPVAADSNAISESFGSYLVSSGQITEETREATSRKMVETKALFGETLVRMEIFSKDQLFALLRKHTYHLLLNSFLSRQGEFEFESLAQIPTHLPRIEFNPFLLMLAAQSRLLSIRALESLLEIKKAFYPVMEARVGQLLPLLNLKGELGRFFQSLKPNRSIEDQLQSLNEKDRENALRVIYLFESIQLLSWNEHADADLAPIDVPHVDFSSHLGEEKSLEATEVEQQISSEYMDILNKNYFEMLGLPTDANERSIEEAYRSLRFQKHPDRYGPGLSGQAKRILDDILSRLDQAYQTLSDPIQRDEYIQTIKRLSASSVADSQKYLEALELHREGRKFLEKALFEEAKSRFEKAHATWKSGVEYRAYALYAEFKLAQKKNDRPEMSRILHSLRELAYSHLQSEVRLLFLSHAYKSSNQRDAAREAYRKALELNVHSTEAENSLASLAEKPDSAWQKEIKVSKASAFKGTGYLVGFIFAVVAAFFASRVQSTDPNKLEINAALIQSIVPASGISHKAQTTKIFLPQKSIEDMPDAILKSKCAQLFEKLRPYGSMRLYFIVEEQGLKAFCTNETLQRF